MIGNLFLIANIVPSSDALVTSSDALVTSSDALVANSFLLLMIGMVDMRPARKLGRVWSMQVVYGGLVDMMSAWPSRVGRFGDDESTVAPLLLEDPQVL